MDALEELARRGPAVVGEGVREQIGVESSSRARRSRTRDVRERPIVWGDPQPVGLAARDARLLRLEACTEPVDLASMGFDSSSSLSYSARCAWVKTPAFNIFASCSIASSFMRICCCLACCTCKSIVPSFMGERRCVGREQRERPRHDKAHNRSLSRNSHAPLKNREYSVVIVRLRGVLGTAPDGQPHPPTTTTRLPGSLSRLAGERQERLMVAAPVFSLCVMFRAQ